MTKVTMVRRARWTGYSKQYRIPKGCIYLGPELIGKRVIVISVQEYREKLRRLKFLETTCRKMERLL